jgi:hypothetical protein
MAAAILAFTGVIAMNFLDDTKLIFLPLVR